MPAARSLWNGTITFGSVAIPVKLFSASSSHALRFREVRASDGATIEHKRIGAESGDEIAYGDIVKAYDDGGRQIVLTKEEIAAAEGPHPKVIAIEHFVAADEIDPVFYDKPYLVGAQDAGVHAYRVLLAALERTEKVGIGRFVLRSRENLVALRPLGGALGLQTMRFDDELVDKGDLELPSMRKAPGDREVTMAGKLVEMLRGDWDPEEHEDTYRDAVMDLIERKRKGLGPKKAKRRSEEGGDLAAALEASLAGGRPGRGATKTGTRKGGTTGSSSSSKGSSSKGSSKASSKGSSSKASSTKGSSRTSSKASSSTSSSSKATSSKASSAKASSSKASSSKGSKASSSKASKASSSTSSGSRTSSGRAAPKRRSSTAKKKASS